MAAFIKEATSRNNVQLLWISFSLAFKITNTIYKPKTIYHEFYELVPSPHFSVSLHKRHSYSGNQGSERASHCPRPPAEGPGRTRTQAGLVWSPRSRIKSLPTTPLCHVSPLSAVSSNLRCHQWQPMAYNAAHYSYKTPSAGRYVIISEILKWGCIQTQTYTLTYLRFNKIRYSPSLGTNYS